MDVIWSKRGARSLPGGGHKVQQHPSELEYNQAKSSKLYKFQHTQAISSKIRQHPAKPSKNPATSKKFKQHQSKLIQIPSISSKFKHIQHFHAISIIFQRFNSNSSNFKQRGLTFLPTLKLGGDTLPKLKEGRHLVARAAPGARRQASHNVQIAQREVPTEGTHPPQLLCSSGAQHQVSAPMVGRAQWAGVIGVGPLGGPNGPGPFGLGPAVALGWAIGPGRARPLWARPVGLDLMGQLHGAGPMAPPIGPGPVGAPRWA